MSDSRTYGNVTEAVFTCVKTTSASEHGTTYDPPNSNSGKATTKVPLVGTIVLGFDFDPSAKSVSYTLISKPGIVPESAIWDGLQSTITGCGGG